VGVVDVAVVYESMFGNTPAIAEAVTEGMREADINARVVVLGVLDSTPDKIGEPALVVVGGPTHMRGMSKVSSRRRALRDAENATTADGGRIEAESGVEGPGVREWLDALPRPRRGCSAAAFDTRLHAPLAGGAARSLARRLRLHGYKVVAKPAGFVVDGAHGPLRQGELGRAKAWGAGFVRQQPGHARR
jgi:hypothetical protein